MHRCLRLPEILEMIFRLVFDAQFTDPVFNEYRSPEPVILSFSNTEGQRSILNLALTCCAFRDLGLDVLHSRMREIWSLMKSLPDELILSTIPTPAHTTPEQFRQLVLRAARVQILHNRNLRGDDSAYILFFASTPKDAPLFPKLRSLGWYDSRAASIPALKLLLPTVDTLALDISNAPFRKEVLKNLRTASPRLKALEFVGVVDTLATSELESLLLSYPEGLTELSIRCFRDNISNSLLEAIAAWPRLRYLTLQIGFRSMPLHVPQPFQALTDLHMSCENLNLLTSFLHYIPKMDSDTSRCPNLRKLYIITCRCSPASIWSELLTLLTRTKLEHILIVEKCSYGQVTCHTGPSSFELRPFLTEPIALADLKTLLISPAHNMSITLTDTDIHALARACPHLYSISLGNHNTPVSLGVLGYIVGRCRKLCKVSLCVDARLDALGKAPMDDDEQVRLQPNRRLKKLDIGKSPIAHAGPLDPPTAPDLMMSIPRFLHMMAPRLAKLETSLGLYFERMQETRNNVERWKKVENALSKLAQGDTD